MESRRDPVASAPPGGRADLVRRSAAFLPPNSEIRQVFIYQTAPNFFVFVLIYLTGLPIFWANYRCVAVTPDAIYILASSKPSGGAKPQRLISTLPRRTALGPIAGRWGQMQLIGERCWVHKRFHDQIAAADCRRYPLHHRGVRLTTAFNRLLQLSDASVETVAFTDHGFVSCLIPARAS